MASRSYARTTSCLVVIGVVLGLAVAMTDPQPAEACSCRRGGSLQQAIAKAAQVFLGKVEQVSATGGRYLLVTLRMQESFKGPNNKTVKLRTASARTACGVAFRKGEVYVVFAPLGAASIVTTCGSTSRVKPRSLTPIYPIIGHRAGRLARVRALAKGRTIPSRMDIGRGVQGLRLLEKGKFNAASRTCQAMLRRYPGSLTNLHVCTVAACARKRTSDAQAYVKQLSNIRDRVMLRDLCLGNSVRLRVR